MKTHFHSHVRPRPSKKHGLSESTVRGKKSAFLPKGDTHIYKNMFALFGFWIEVVLFCFVLV